MGISGNLKTMELSELLQWLSQGQKTGTLVIDSGLVAKRIFFRNGRVISSASTDPKEHLGHFLVSHGYIDERQLSTAIARQEQEKSLLGRVLVGMGALTEEQLEHMLRLKAEEGIYGLWSWPEGEFHFRDDDLPGYDMVPISLDVTGIVLEATRRLDELNRIRTLIPSIKAVPVVVSEKLLDDPELDEGQRRILAAIDDDRTIEEIALETHASDYYVSETIYPKVLAKQVKVVRARGGDASGVFEVAFKAEDLLQRAQVHLKDNDLENAMRHLRAARSLEPDNQRVQREAEQAEAIVRRSLEKEGFIGSSVPHLNLAIDELTKVKVSPKAGFLLSRINGSYDLASILKISPMPQLEATLVLRELVNAGHVRLERK